MSPSVPGVRNRERHDTFETVVPLSTQSTTANGRAFRLWHDFSLPTTVDTIVQSLALNDTDNTAWEWDIQVLDTYITVPAWGIWIRYTWWSEWYRAIEVGECCWPLQLEDELWYSDREDNNQTVWPVFLPEGQHAFRAWNIDSGGTNSSHIVRYSVDGENFWASLPAWVELSVEKRSVECQEIGVCDTIPEWWSLCYPKLCVQWIVDPDPMTEWSNIEFTECKILRESSNPSTYDGQYTPTNWRQYTDPLDTVSLENTESCDMNVEVFIEHPAHATLVEDARIYIYNEYRILRNGTAIDGWRRSWYDYTDNRNDPNGASGTVEYEIEVQNTVVNLVDIIASPWDVITAEYRSRYRLVADDGNYNEILRFYDGQIRILMMPNVVYVPVL